jgi:hypothetical protein
MRRILVTSTLPIIASFASLLIVGCIGMNRPVTRRDGRGYVMPLHSGSDCAVVSSGDTAACSTIDLSDVETRPCVPDEAELSEDEEPFEEDGEDEEAGEVY